MTTKTSTARRNVSPLAKVALALVGLVQIGLALAAFSDLWARPATQVRMTKPAWIPIILINWIGPFAYFVGGVKR
ncbi:PLDc N-terminal domain-containing protein [Microbacterium paludicola]|uniref:PLDc N-terminal domain-containing protein n=1 Tax=Microbacterium paludicola TaxID=300019 RepID=UPI003879C9A7